MYLHYTAFNQKGFGLEYADFNEIPAKKQCSLKEACEYLAFCKKPISFKYDPIIKEMLKKHPDELPEDLNANLIKPGNAKYDKNIQKVGCKLCDMLKNGTITAINFRGEVIPPKIWKDVTTNDIIEDRLCVKIEFEQLKTAMPVKQYKVTLEDDGILYASDGKKTVVINKIRPGYKKYEWLKFYFEHPNQTISEQDMSDRFKDPDYKFIPKDDAMNQCVFNTFANHVHIMHKCFPILGSTEIRCTPTFMGTDVAIF